MKRIRYHKQEEAFLQFRSGELWEYAQEAPATVLPDKPWALLQHMASFAQFVEALLVHCVSQSEEAADPYAWLREPAPQAPDEDETSAREREEAQQIDVPQMLEVAWRWHGDLAGRREPMTGHYAHAFFLSWVTLAQLFYLSHEQEPERLHQLRHWRAQDYAHFQRASARHTLEITSLPIAMYTLQDLWVSVRLIVTATFYAEPYSADMRRYFFALFYRYCELLTVEQSDAELLVDNPLFLGERQSDARDDEDGEELDNEEAHNAYKRLTVPLTPTLSLSSAYVYDGQSLFYAQLHRLLLSDRLETLQRLDPLRLREPLDAQACQRCDQAWLQTVGAVCADPELGQFVLTDFKCELMRLHLYHGEVEQYRRHFPRSQASPTEVMRTLRGSDHDAALQIHVTPLSELLARAGEYERECWFLTRQTTARWFAFRRVKAHAALMELFQLEQLCSLDALDAATLRSEREGPLLLGLMRQYYVVEGRRVYRSQSYVQAYLLWLARLLRRELIALTHVHPTLQACIALFETF